MRRQSVRILATLALLANGTRKAHSVPILVLRGSGSAKANAKGAAEDKLALLFLRELLEEVDHVSARQNVRGTRLLERVVESIHDHLE